MSDRILIADNLDEITDETLRQSGFSVERRTGLSRDELLSILPEYEAVLVRSAVVLDREMIDQMTSCRVIGRAGVGVDNIDVEAATEAGIVVMNVPTGTTASVSELTILLILSMLRRVHVADRSIRSGKWERKAFLGRELGALTVGVIGFGHIGSAVGSLLQGFGTRVLAFDPHITPSAILEQGIEPVTLDELLRDADIVTLHLPLNDETEGIIGTREIGLMKAGSYLVNAARGGLIDSVAMESALESGHLAGVALDVYPEEPPTLPESVLASDTSIFTPHIAASTEEAQLNVGRQIARQVGAFLRRGEAGGFVNARGAAAILTDEYRQHVAAGRRIGRLAVGLGSDAADSIEVRIWGEMPEEIRNGIGLAVQAGFLGEDVNLVNVESRIQRSGLQTSISWEGSHDRYEALIEVYSGNNRLAVAVDGSGTVRLVRINGRALDLELQGNLLIVEHRDQPGMLASIAATLAEDQINIAGLSLGREGEATEAVAVVVTDQAPGDEAVERIRALDSIGHVAQVSLGQ